MSKKTLSNREAEILRFLPLSQKEIASRLHLSPQTVKSYLKNIANKLGTSNRVELVIFALKNDLIKLDEFDF